MRARLPQLDGIRAIAILLVIFHNQGGEFPSLHLETVFANGWMGVDLFFVLSGFLITGILLDARESDAYFRNFYVRRCLRIWPLYLSLLFLMFVVVPAIRPSEAIAITERASPRWSYLLFLQNLLVKNPTHAVGPLGVTWSLAIEEQFYLVWPWIVRFCSARRLRTIALSVICLSPVLRLLMNAYRVNLYSNTFSRLDGLMAGALLASLIRSVDFVPARFVKPAWIIFCSSLPLAFVLEAYHQRWIVFSLSALASTALVFLALYSPQKWLKAGLSNRFMVYTGTISFGLYLLHKLPFDLAEAFHLDRNPVVGGPLLLVACWGVAAVSWNLLEKPFLKLKRFFELKQRIVLHGV